MSYQQPQWFGVFCVVCFLLFVCPQVCVCIDGQKSSKGLNLKRQIHVRIIVTHLAKRIEEVFFGARHVCAY